MFCAMYLPESETMISAESRKSAADLDIFSPQAVHEAETGFISASKLRFSSVRYITPALIPSLRGLADPHLATFKADFILSQGQISWRMCDISFHS